MCRLELDQHCIFAGELLQNDIIDLEGFAGMLIEFPRRLSSLAPTRP